MTEVYAKINPLDRFEDLDDLVLNGNELVEKFIKRNHRQLTVTQICNLFSITPEILQDVLTEKQFAQIGAAASQNILILRSSKDFEEDYQNVQD